MSAGCKLGDFPEAAESSSHSRTLKNFTVTDTSGEEVRWVMRGSRALFESDESEEIDTEEIEAELYSGDGEKTVLRAGRGVFSRFDGRMTASEGVVILSGGREIHTNDVEWFPEEEVFITDAEVRVLTPAGEVRGTGMRASKDLEDITLLSRISGSFNDLQ